MEKIQIGRSRIKSLFLILGGIGFVIVSIWTLKTQEPEILDKIVCIIGVIFFGSAIPLGIKQLFVHEYALELTKHSLIIEPESNKRQFIPWNKITEFNELKIHGTKFITIVVSDPGEWISNESNPLKKKLMQFNNKAYGTPFNITSAGLNITHRKLLRLLLEYHSK